MSEGRGRAIIVEEECLQYLLHHLQLDILDWPGSDDVIPPTSSLRAR